MSGFFTESQRAEFQAAFDLFDKNGDRRLNPRELSALIREALGPYQHISEKELIELI